MIPCWVDAPSTLQAAHSHHGKNIVAIHLKDGGYRCCCIDDKEPITFSLPENTSLVEGWHNRESSWDEKIKRAIKMMYSFLPNKPKYIGEVEVNDIFAWLAKQGEQRYLTGVDLGDPAGDKGCIFNYSDATIPQKDFAPLNQSN